MYEHYISAFKNGLKNIDVEIDEDEFWQDTSDGDEPINPAATTVTVTFAVTTDSEACITIDGNGFIYPSFGGTGTNEAELDRYAEQAVEIWRTITDDHSTTCRYKVSDEDPRDQDDLELVVNA